ncbi:MAG TPA: mandelate racemase/muconate lactonizing enzyme family protein [Thermoguttaceae bacterium]|nr:mandelate racemase/muconate lactonizing enzyme family protein [Thermoguttaceae bacterium]
MKIECIRTHHLRHRLDEPFGFSQWTYDTRNALLVEILADGGIAGWGECYGPAEVNQAAVAGFYAPRLLGKDPAQIDVLWHEMWRASLDFARGGVMMGAISGIDMALWDLKGKALGCSVSGLMGGRYHESVPCYATGMYFKKLPEDALIEALAREATGYRDQGYRALKIKVGKNVAFDLRLIETIRDALPEMTLMADANHAYDLPEAIRVGKALDEARFAWFEEPLSPEHPELHRALHEKVDLAIASGECEQTRFGFQRLLGPGGVQIAQPDLAYCGGPSEALKIRAVASSHGVNVIPHVWGTMLNLAAATHLLAASYREPGRAEMPAPWLEYDRTPNALRDEIFETSVRIDDGSARVPPGPGLGVLPDRSAMTAFQVHQTEVR